MILCHPHGISHAQFQLAHRIHTKITRPRNAKPSPPTPLLHQQPNSSGLNHLPALSPIESHLSTLFSNAPNSPMKLYHVAPLVMSSVPTLAIGPTSVH